MPSHDIALSILYAALSEPIGLILSTNDVVAAKMKLYSARKKSADPSLDDLQIRQSPQSSDELLLVNRRIQLQAVKAGK